MSTAATGQTGDGRLFGDRYRLRTLLGAGGMGEVWRADDERLSRPVAVKLIRGTGEESGQALARFRREAKITARLSGHPNIVTVYDFSEDPLYVVMEVIEGSSLDTLVGAGRRPPWAEAVGWTLQVCEALGAAHAAGITHRDLKPSNLMLTRSGTVKVLDFGIAGLHQGGEPAPGTRGYTRLTMSGCFLGSPPYAAPEQIRGGRADPRTDLYSLGCLLFELLTGVPPFGAGPLHSLLVRHLQEPPPSPRALRTDLPGELDRLVLDLLAKDPADRPPGAEAVRQRLHRLAPAVAYTPTVADGVAGDAAAALGDAAPADGLRLARVFDLTAPDGRPGMAAAHERVTSVEERIALLHALRAAPIAVHALGPEPDRVEPARGPVVPAGFRTDGVWVWSDQIAYYLDRYGLAPEPGLRHHLTARAPHRAAVPPRMLSAAGRLVRTEPEGSLTGRPSPHRGAPGRVGRDAPLPP